MWYLPGVTPFRSKRPLASVVVLVMIMNALNVRCISRTAAPAAGLPVVPSMTLPRMCNAFVFPADNGISIAPRFAPGVTFSGTARAKSVEPP